MPCVKRSHDLSNEGLPPSKMPKRFFQARVQTIESVWSLIRDTAWASCVIQASPLPPSRMSRSITAHSLAEDPGSRLKKRGGLLQQVEQAISTAGLGADQGFLHQAVAILPQIIRLGSVYPQRHVVAQALLIDGMELKHLDYPHRDDPELVGIAVTQNGLALQYATPDLRGRRDIVTSAVSNNGCALLFVEGYLKEDEQLVLLAIASAPSIVANLPPTLRRKESFMEKAAEVNGLVIKYAPSPFRGSWRFCLNAVSQNGLALRYVTPPLSLNPVIQEAACRQNGLALKFAKSYVRVTDTATDYVGLAALRQNGLALNYADPIHKRTLESVMLAVSSHGMAIEYVHDSLQFKREVMLLAVEKSYYALPFIASRSRGSIDCEILFTALVTAFRGAQQPRSSATQYPANADDVQDLGISVLEPPNSSPWTEDDFGPMSWFRYFRQQHIKDQWMDAHCRHSFCMAHLLGYRFPNEHSRTVKRRVLEYVGPMSASRAFQSSFQAKLCEVPNWGKFLHTLGTLSIHYQSLE